MKLFRSYYNLLEAGFAQSLLESSGTSAVLEHEHLFSGLLVRDVWTNLLGVNRTLEDRGQGIPTIHSPSDGVILPDLLSRRGPFRQVLTRK